MHIYQYQKKLAEIRKALDGTGVTVKARPVNGRRNLWEYRLGIQEESTKQVSGGEEWAQ
jgi:hypothetical protein